MAAHGRVRGAVVVASLLIFCAGCADQLLLAPSHQPITVDLDCTSQTVALADHCVIEVWKARSAATNGHEPQAFVLRFCGNGERGEQAVQSERGFWSELPVEVWAVNYPGFGGSTGPAQLRKLPPMALAVYDDLAKHAAGRPILVSGMSMGTTVALFLAANRPVDGLVLRSPVPVRDVITGRYGWWNLWLLAGPVAAGFPAELDADKNARRVTAPAVFIITANDELVPRAYQRQITGAYAGKKKLLIAEQAFHNTPLTDREVEKLQEDLHWLWPKRATPSRPASSRTRGVH